METAVDALGREVDMTRTGERGCRDPEHLLVIYPANEKVWDFVEEFPHERAGPVKVSE